MDLTIRPVVASDAGELSALLNEIVAKGGTTARERPIRTAEFLSDVVESPNLICCFTAQDGDGKLVGYQKLSHNPNLAHDWGDIATFAKVGSVTRGIGTALFEATRNHAVNANLVAINATIRSDNTGGLRYYDKMGFSTYKIDEAVPLMDGTPVDRISKKFTLPLSA